MVAGVCAAGIAADLRSQDSLCFSVSAFARPAAHCLGDKGTGLTDPVTGSSSVSCVISLLNVDHLLHRSEHVRWALCELLLSHQDESKVLDFGSELRVLLGELVSVPHGSPEL